MDKIKLRKVIQKALSEDKVKQDKTTNLIVPPAKKGKAVIIAKDRGIFCGRELIQLIFKEIDPEIKINLLVEDGDKIKKDQKIAHISGKLQAILAGERVCLNFISLLSGVSTSTNSFVVKAGKKKVKIKDTRKTTPGLRGLEKYAVLVGGGKNHRQNLFGGIIIKDNHLKAAGIINKKSQVNHQKLAILWQSLRRKTKMPIEVEVENFREFKEIISYNPEIIMLDNFSIADLKKAAAYRDQYFPKIELEASGGVTIKNIETVSATGVDSVSVGVITHSSQALDFSLEIDEI